MGKVTYKTGDKYRDIMLTGKAYSTDKRKYVEFICCCGNTNWGRLDSIKSDRIKSCGCRISRIGTIGVSQRTSSKHGKSRHPLYKTWGRMITRCTNKKLESYKNYGGRGISVCNEWAKSFPNFYEWAINNKWDSKLSLDRIDNNKGYSPENCRWATSAAQVRNRRVSVNLTAFGETKCIADWHMDKRCVVGKNTITHRMNVFGWTAEKAITTKVIKNKRDNGRFIKTLKIS